jgi:hypothetical protein
MKGRLSEVQLEYILEHLGHHAFLGGIRSLIRYGKDRPSSNPSIFFKASEEALDTDRIIWSNGIPVLYPVVSAKSPLFGFEGPNLFFHHDLLKSAFHLLSGYEEINNRVADRFGRFPYEASLQYRLGIIGKPVVNYYFEIILDAIGEFARMNHLHFQRDPLLRNPILMLSHDIDRTGGFGLFETGFRFKQLFGLAESPYTIKGKTDAAFTALFHLLNPFSRKDPYWTFDALMKWTSERDFRSTYFFLEKEGGRNENSRYRFHSRKFRSLFQKLAAAGHEIALHGTIRSATSRSAMSRTLQRLREASPEPVTGVRQHYLKWIPGETPLIQEKEGLKYDASLGFAEQDGFRNSYCWPFRLFDFANHRSMSLWEIPLTFMDVTHFYYRRLDLPTSRASIEALAAETARFNGVFSLLWHNHFFDEREFPGITDYFTGILDYCKRMKMDGITGREILDRMLARKD